MIPMLCGWLETPSTILAREQARAAVAIDRALKLNPNAAHAWMARGWVSCCQQ